MLLSNVIARLEEQRSQLGTIANTLNTESHVVQDLAIAVKTLNELVFEIAFHVKNHENKLKVLTR